MSVHLWPTHAICWRRGSSPAARKTCHFASWALIPGHVSCYRSFLKIAFGAARPLPLFHRHPRWNCGWESALESRPQPYFAILYEWSGASSAPWISKMQRHEAFAFSLTCATAWGEVCWGRGTSKTLQYRFLIALRLALILRESSFCHRGRGSIFHACESSISKTNPYQLRSLHLPRRFGYCDRKQLAWFDAMS